MVTVPENDIVRSAVQKPIAARPGVRLPRCSGVGAGLFGGQDNWGRINDVNDSRSYTMPKDGPINPAPEPSGTMTK